MHFKTAVILGILVHTTFVVSLFIEYNTEDEEIGNNLFRRQVKGMCFEETADAEKLEENIKKIFMDPAVTECYEGLPQEEIYKCLASNILTMEESYMNVTAEFCPKWRGSKQCLAKYLTSRCNQEERDMIKKSAAFDSEVVLPSLMCEPDWNDELRSILSQSQESGLWNCFLNNTDFVTRFKRCTLGSRYVRNGTYLEYSRALHNFARCTKGAMKICTGRDRMKELKLKAIWSRVEDTFNAAPGLFWDEINQESDDSKGVD